MATNEEILAELSEMKERLHEIDIARARREGFAKGRRSVFETMKQLAQIIAWVSVAVGALWAAFGWLYPISKAVGD